MVINFIVSSSELYPREYPVVPELGSFVVLNTNTYQVREIQHNVDKNKIAVFLK